MSDFQLTTKKQSDGTSIVKNKDTNEPIAILSPANRWRRNAVNTRWHPDFKQTHPELSHSLLHGNYTSGIRDSDGYHNNAQEAVKGISKYYKDIHNGEYDHGDPVKHEYAGTESTIGATALHNIHKYHLLDDEGNHFATIKSEHGPEKINRNSQINNATYDEGYMKQNKISDYTKEASNSKHPGTRLSEVMNRARYILDNKDKEPRFVGKQTAARSSSQSFKTKMNPEDASKAYEEALKKQLTDEGGKTNYTFTRHSPTLFMAHKPHDENDTYSEGVTHTIHSLPGELQHTTSTYNHPDYHPTRYKNDSVVESVQ